MIEPSTQYLDSVANYTVNSNSESLKITAQRLMTRSTSFSGNCTKTPYPLFQLDESDRKPDIPKKPLSRKWAWLNNEEVSDSKPQSSTTFLFPSGDNHEFSSISTRLRSLSLSTVASTETEKNERVPHRRKSTKIKEMARRFEAFKTVDGSDVTCSQEKPLVPPRRIVVPIANPNNLNFSTDSLHSPSSSSEPSVTGVLKQGSFGFDTRVTSGTSHQPLSKTPSPTSHAPKTGEESMIMKEEPLKAEGSKDLEGNIPVRSQNGGNDSIELECFEFQTCQAGATLTRPAKHFTEDISSVVVEDAAAAVLGDQQSNTPLGDLQCLKNIDSGTLDIRYETNTNVDENQLEADTCVKITSYAANDSPNVGVFSSVLDIANPESSVKDVPGQICPTIKANIVSENNQFALPVSENDNTPTSSSSPTDHTEENSKDVFISPKQNPEKSSNIFCAKESIKDVIADESEEIIFEKKTPPNQMQRLYSFVVDEDATSYQITSLSAISGEESSDPDSGDDDEETTFTQVNSGSELVPGFKREVIFVSNFNENAVEKPDLTSRKPDCGRVLILQSDAENQSKVSKSSLGETELSHARNINDEVSHSIDLDTAGLLDKQDLSSSNQILSESSTNDGSTYEDTDKVTEEENSEFTEDELQIEGQKIQKKTEFDDQTKSSTSTDVNSRCHSLDSSKDLNDSFTAGSDCVSVHVGSHLQEIVPEHADYNSGFIKSDNLEVEKSDGTGFEKYDSSEIESGTGSFSGSPDHCLKISESITISENSNPEIGLKSSRSPENSLENRPLTPSPPSSPSSTNTGAQQHNLNFPQQSPTFRDKDIISGEDEIFSSRAEDSQADQDNSLSCEEEDSTGDILESVAKRFCELEEDKSTITQTSLSSVLGSDKESQQEVEFEAVVETMTEQGVAELATRKNPTVHNSVLSNTGCVEHNFQNGEEEGEILSNSEKQIKEPKGDENIIVSSYFNESVSSGTTADLNYSTFVKRRETSIQLFSDIPSSQQTIGKDARLKSQAGISNDLTIFSQNLENADQQMLPEAYRSSAISSCSEVSETTTECSEMTADQDDLLTENTASVLTVRQTLHSHDMSALTGENRVSLSGGELHAVRVKIDLGSEDSMQKLKQLKKGGSKTSDNSDDGFDVIEVRVEDMDDISDATFLTAEDIRKMTSTEKLSNQPLIITPDTEHIDSYDFLDLSPQLHARRSLSPRMTENSYLEGLCYHHDHTIDYDYVPSPVDMEDPGISYFGEAVRISSPQEGTMGTFTSPSTNFENFVYSSHRSVDISASGVTKVVAANNMVTKFERKKSYQPLEQITINFDRDTEVQNQTSSRNVTFSTVEFNKKLIQHEPEPKRSKSWRKNSLKGIFRKMKSITNNSADLEPEPEESEMEISGPILISSSSEVRAKTNSNPNAGSYSFSTQKVTLEELSISELDNSICHSVSESNQRSPNLGSGVQIINRVDGFFIPNQDSSHTDQSQIGKPNLTSGRHDNLNSISGSVEESSGVHSRLVFKKSDPLAPDPFCYRYEAENSSIKKGADVGHTSKNGIDKLAKVMKWKRK